MVTVTKFCSEFNEQVNPNLAKRNHWENNKNAIGKTDKLASSTYTKKEVKDKKGKKTTEYNYPYKVTAHKFNFNIPLNAVIKKITVGVRMKTSKNKTGSTFPAVGFYIADKKASVSDAKKNKTGWHNGIYWRYSDTKLSTTLHTEKYVMSESEFNKGNYSIKNLNDSYFGVDINFADEKIDPQTIYVKWVWCEIEYELPELSLTCNYKSSKSDPYDIKTGVSYSAIFTLKNKTSAKCGTKKFKFKPPSWGTEIESMVYDGTYNNGEWSVPLNGKKEVKFRVNFKDYTVNDQSMSLTDMDNEKNTIVAPTGYKVPIVNHTLYYRTIRGKVDGYDETTIRYGNRDSDNNNPPHKRELCCYNITSKFQSSDNQITYNIQHTQPFILVKATADVGLCDNGVSLSNIILYDGTDAVYNNSNVSIEVQGYSVPPKTYFIPANTYFALKWTVPEDGEYHWGATLCGYFLETGNQTITGKSMDSKLPQTLNINVFAPYVYHIGATANDVESSTDPNYGIHYRLVTERVNFTNHRIASNLETGAFVLPCRIKDGDALMYEYAPNIHMYKWEQIDYIGCVPIEHYHFDPKSTYKDKLLDNHYKNKRYMGKELASDEDIDLNIRLHPKQVTTIQGLIDMDKPIPINANHKIFEGDSLNHRGWAEIYGITAEKTNEHWYKCSIDVKYLTHNLNTRFKIKKGSKTFSNYSIPSLLSEVKSSGEAITTDQLNDFFTVDTDGSYAYIEEDIEVEDFLDENGEPVTWNENNTTLTVTNDDGTTTTYTGYDVLDYLEEIGVQVTDTLIVGEHIQEVSNYTPSDDLRNQFTLDEGQHILIKSRKPLSKNNEITLYWSSSLLNEIKENHISRVVSINDKDGNSVFEYEYFDFGFEDFESYESISDGTITSKLSCRVIGRKRDKSDYIEVINQEINLICDVEADADEGTLDYYGSTLHFRLNNNNLQVIDEGYSGKEISSDNITLEDSDEYYYECMWINKNTDGEDNDITAYLDLVVQDNILDSRYSELYGGLYVSPFPVNGKEIAFTRNAEEGVIYYLKDKEEEFSYLIEPYYQYHNGVDLRASSDGEDYISIFNLNYGYKTIYLENGLVSLGINRLNGQMYLRKWDDVAKAYVTLFNLKLNKFDDVNINSISDDRIELQASDTIISMYRGHPYVIFKHQTEDIGLSSTFNRVWGQKVDNYESSDYPVMFDLMNTDNLLPMSVTGKLDDDTVDLDEHTVRPAPSPTPITLSYPTGDVYENDEVTFTVTGMPTGSKVHYLINGDELGSTTDGTFKHTFDKPTAYSIIAVYVGDDTHAYSVSNEIILNVLANPVEEPTGEGEGSGTGTGGSSGGSDTPAPLIGDKLTMSCPKTFKYRDNQKIVYTLTSKGRPVPHAILEVVDFNVINTEKTDENGQVILYNKRANSSPKKYKLGARYIVNGSVKKQVWKDATVKKATPRFTFVTPPIMVGGSFMAKLVSTPADNVTHTIGGANVVVKVNSHEYKKKTDKNGFVTVKINKKGTYKYTCTFAGNKNYNKCTYKTREVLK